MLSLIIQGKGNGVGAGGYLHLTDCLVLWKCKNTIATTGTSDQPCWLAEACNSSSSSVQEGESYKLLTAIEAGQLW